MEQQTELGGEERQAQEEEKLREEAARRMERRRRKMLSPEERLAKITGQPVGESIVAEEAASPGDLPGLPGEEGSPNHLTLNSEDPPLELLTRDPTMARGSPGPEPDLLSSLLGTGAATPQENPVRFSHLMWLLLALAVRLILETEYKFYIMESGIMPFLLLLPVLMVTGYLHLPSLRSTSLLTAALMLCGVGQYKVATLTRTLHLGSILLQCFSVYLFCFLLSHVLIVNVLDAIL